MNDISVQNEMTMYIENLYCHLNLFIEFTERYNRGISENFGIKKEERKSSSELINIRDIFMHYLLYYEAEERALSADSLEQWYYILEHGQRAAKDQVIFFCQEILIKDLLYWLNKLESNGRHLQAIKATRKLMHEVKNTILKIRISSANGIRITENDMKDVIMKLQMAHIEYSKTYYPIIKKVCYPDVVESMEMDS